MKRIGLTWQVDPDIWDEYKEIHLNPCPELIEALQAAGIHNYNIFAFGTRAFTY
ncbi:MAG: L-rhamnose mutarotase [Chloroflexi bacterium]|nr:L-rhamnose mutarotase [Chloroflexota bacterium]